MPQRTKQFRQGDMFVYGYDNFRNDTDMIPSSFNVYYIRHHDIEYHDGSVPFVVTVYTIDTANIHPYIRHTTQLWRTTRQSLRAVLTKEYIPIDQLSTNKQYLVRSALKEALINSMPEIVDLIKEV